METVAVYWEQIIRVYGIDQRPGVGLLAITCHDTQLPYYLSLLQQAGAEQATVLLFQLEQHHPETSRLQLVLPADSARQLHTACRQAEQSGLAAGTSELQLPVDLLYLHGPHFQDRYGIAEAALRSLPPQQVELLAMCCTGTSIYLVTAGGQAELARRLLGNAFVIPGGDKSPEVR